MVSSGEEPTPKIIVVFVEQPPAEPVKENTREPKWPRVLKDLFNKG